MERGEDRFRRELLATGDKRRICNELLASFTEVSDFRAFLTDHPETQDLYLLQAPSVEYVECYLDFCLTKEQGEEELVRIIFYVFHRGGVHLLSRMGDYDFFGEKTGPAISCVLVVNGYVDVFEFLLSRGLTQHPKITQRCLSEAAKQNKTDIARLLLHHGVDSNVPDNWREKPFFDVIRWSSLQMLHLFVCHGADLVSASEEVWRVACLRGDGEIMTFIHSMGVPMPRNIFELFNRDMELRNRSFSGRIKITPEYLAVKAKTENILLRLQGSPPPSSNSVRG